MILLLANSAMILLVATAVFQTVYVLFYRRQMRILASPGDSNYQPKTAIILCLRGIDPDLEDCLTGIAHQTYTKFDLHVVLDHESDPSRPVITDFVKRKAEIRFRVHLHTLDTIRHTGSLKCQSLVHAINNLADDTEVVAFIDADAIVDNQWLARLVEPLANSKIGATTGNRWFSPPDDRLGSWVREIWNSAAIVQMQLYQIPWGGSLAIKRSVLEKTNLLTRWQSALCEDTLLPGELRPLGLQVHRVISLVVNNCEATSLPSAVDWIARQLLTVRLYHPYWPGVFGHAIAVGLCVVAVPAIALSLAIAGASKMASAVLCAWCAYQLVNGLLLGAIRVPNRRILGITGRHVPIAPWKYAVALLWTQVIQPVAACQAMFARTVRWRGIDYQIEDAATVSITNYQPYREVQQTAEESIP